MNNKIIIGLIIVIVIVIGFYLFKSYQVPNISPSISPTTNQSEPISPNTIVIKNFSFNPTPMTVKTGDTVTWINQDSASHDIKIGDITSPKFQQGGQFQYTFNTAGTFNYSCGIHPTMTGIIIVE